MKELLAQIDQRSMSLYVDTDTLELYIYDPIHSFRKINFITEQREAVDSRDNKITTTESVSDLELTVEENRTKTVKSSKTKTKNA